MNVLNSEKKGLCIFLLLIFYSVIIFYSDDSFSYIIFDVIFEKYKQNVKKNDFQETNILSCTTHEWSRNTKNVCSAKQ